MANEEEEDAGLLEFRVRDYHKRVGKVEKDINGLGSKMTTMDKQAFGIALRMETMEKTVGKIEKAVDKLKMEVAFIVAFVTIGIQLVFKFWK